jgi:hypothetical protein
MGLAWQAYGLGHLAKSVHAQNRAQRFAEISGRDPFEVKGWNQGIDAGSPPHVLGQTHW